MNMYRYEIILYWSADDAAFIAEVPELPGCMAHGDTQDDALHHAQEAMAAWIEVAKEIGRPIPEPRGRLMYA
jgi:predicted RNase H-like HicB family nuclease